MVALKTKKGLLWLVHDKNGRRKANVTLIMLPTKGLLQSNISVSKRSNPQRKRIDWQTTR